VRCDRCREVVHGADKGLAVGGFAPDAGRALGRLARPDHAGKLGPAAQTIAQVTHAGKDVGWRVCGKQRRDGRRDTIARAVFLQQVQRNEGVQYDRRGAWIGLDSRCHGRCAQRLGLKNGKEIQLGRRRDDTRRLKRSNRIEQRRCAWRCRHVQSSRMQKVPVTGCHAHGEGERPQGPAPGAGAVYGLSDNGQRQNLPTTSRRHGRSWYDRAGGGPETSVRSFFQPLLLLTPTPSSALLCLLNVLVLSCSV